MFTNADDENTVSLPEKWFFYNPKRHSHFPTSICGIPSCVFVSVGETISSP